jgi:diacylglycerol kinase
VKHVPAFVRSFVFAGRGVALTARGRNFRVMVLCAVAAVVVGFLRGLDRVEWSLIVVCIGVVLAMEAMNTAVEALADAVHPDRHPGIARAKDAAAGASLIVSIAAAVVAALVLLS